jgi:hypothetical protein
MAEIKKLQLVWNVPHLHLVYIPFFSNNNNTDPYNMAVKL